MTRKKIKLRRDTSARWAAHNPVLAEGEPAVDLDSLLLKVGDGQTRWADLPGIAGGGDNPAAGLRMPTGYDSSHTLTEFPFVLTREHRDRPLFADAAGEPYNAHADLVVPAGEFKLGDILYVAATYQPRGGRVRVVGDPDYRYDWGPSFWTADALGDKGDYLLLGYTIMPIIKAYEDDDYEEWYTIGVTASQPQSARMANAFVTLVATANITLEGHQEIDGSMTTDNDLVLVVGQTDKIENGVYHPSADQWYRSVGFETGDRVNTTSVFHVLAGGTYGGTRWCIGSVSYWGMWGREPVTITQLP